MVKQISPLVILVVVVALVAAACGGGASSDVTKVRDADSVVAGEALYIANCALCHGAELEGGTTPTDVEAPALIDKLRQSDADLVSIALAGKGGTMPAFSAFGLSADDMQLIVDFIRSTQAASQ